MTDAYLVDGARTAIGKFGGALKNLRATEFAASLVSGLLERNRIDPSVIERVVGGRVIQDMTESNAARIVARNVGVPDSSAAFTLNMQCCSGMAAFMQATQAVQVGEVDCALAIGLESLSNASHVVRDVRWGSRLGSMQMIDLLQECSFAGSKLWGNPMAMADVAEKHARVDGISRAEMEEYAVLCHRRTIDAAEAGRFAEEIIGIGVRDRAGNVSVFDRDEHPRADVSLESMRELPTLRPGGTVTAATASGLNDGAAAAIVCSERALDKLRLEPLARVVPNSSAMVGCDPTLMGYSAVAAVEAALDRSNRTLDDMDLIECNEGFAVQLIADARIGGWPTDRLNRDGGSVALGHPVGMSGMRIVVHLAHALRLARLKLGVGVVPAGSGLGTAMILERAS
jgi:acetyl-CoA C-acetyltransferase